MKRLALILLASISAVPALATERWIHMEITSGRKEVKMNLPMRAIERALPHIPAKSFGRVSISCNGSDFSEDNYAVWRTAIEASRKGPATFDDDGDRVVVTREGEWVAIEREDRWDGPHQVRIRAAVIDPLFAGPEPTTEGLRTALANMTAGDVITATNDEGRVRVWIDTSANQY